MDDSVVIARQARKIEELEAKLELSVAAERQLLSILQSAGIKVSRVKLTKDEAQFLEHFRAATSEGKAAIFAKAEELASQRSTRVGAGKGLLAADASGSKKAEDHPHFSKPTANPQANLSGLPKEFFKPNPGEIE